MLLGLDRAGIAAHSGSACSAESIEPSPVLAAMGVDPDRSLQAVGGLVDDRGRRRGIRRGIAFGRRAPSLARRHGQLEPPERAAFAGGGVSARQRLTGGSEGLHGHGCNGADQVLRPAGAEGPAEMDTCGAGISVVLVHGDAQRHCPSG